MPTAPRRTACRHISSSGIGEPFQTNDRLMHDCFSRPFPVARVAVSCADARLAPASAERKLRRCMRGIVLHPKELDRIFFLVCAVILSERFAPSDQDRAASRRISLRVQIPPRTWRRTNARPSTLARVAHWPSPRVPAPRMSRAPVLFCHPERSRAR